MGSGEQGQELESTLGGMKNQDMISSQMTEDLSSVPALPVVLHKL